MLNKQGYGCTTIAKECLTKQSVLIWINRYLKREALGLEPLRYVKTTPEFRLRNDICIYHTHQGRAVLGRITATLHNEGFAVINKTVEHIMQELGVKSLVRPERYRSYRGAQGRIVPNVLQRGFVEGCNRCYRF